MPKCIRKEENIIFKISKKLKSEFKIFCEKEQKTMSEVMSDFIKNYIRENKILNDQTNDTKK